MFRGIGIAVIAGAVCLLGALPVQAVPTPLLDTAIGARGTGGELLQTRQYRLQERLAGGQESMQQTVTVWEVTGGTWNGQQLEGLSLVVVNRISDSDSCAPTTDCYISHKASAAQREALVSAYVAAQGWSAGEAANWHLEMAVIRVEHVGGAVVVHLGKVV